MDRTNVVLWILQAFFGAYFIFVGIMHFIVPEGLPEAMSWMYDLSDGQHAVAGAAEILGGLGLILPGVTKILPGLTVWAAVGLIVVMIGAIVWHLGRDEYSNIAQNIVIAAVLGFVAYGRWRLRPLPSRSEATAA